MEKNKNYRVQEAEDGFRIIYNVRASLRTPYKTIFKTPYRDIAEMVAEDLNDMGPDSYTNGFSSLCHAFTADNLITTPGLYEVIKDELSTAPYENDVAFQPSMRGMPPARIWWDNVFFEPDRADKVRAWIKTLNPWQLASAMTIFQSIGNMNLPYVFGHLIIDEGDEGYMTDLENLYGSFGDGLTSLDDDNINRLFDIFSTFYTAGREE